MVRVLSSYLEGLQLMRSALGLVRLPLYMSRTSKVNP